MVVKKKDVFSSVLILIFQFTPKFNLLNIIGVAQLTGSSATGIYCGRKLGVNFFPKEITLPGFEPQTPWLRVGDSTPRTQRPLLSLLLWQFVKVIAYL